MLQWRRVDRRYERIAMLIKRTLEKKPRDGSTHWSVRAAAAESGISKSSVQRYFDLFGIKPHRTKSFKLSTLTGTFTSYPPTVHG
jgi:putative transposase